MMHSFLYNISSWLARQGQPNLFVSTLYYRLLINIPSVGLLTQWLSINSVVKKSTSWFYQDVEFFMRYRFAFVPFDGRRQRILRLFRVVNFSHS